MKIKVTEDRVFPTLGIIAQAGDEVDVPEDAPAVESKKAKKAVEVKEGDDDGSAS